MWGTRDENFRNGGGGDRRGKRPGRGDRPRLTESLAEEMKDRGVRVNAVLPSIIDTPANRTDMPDADFSRWVNAYDLAHVIRFLLSEEARAITGALLPVTGRV